MNLWYPVQLVIFCVRVPFPHGCCSKCSRSHLQTKAPLAQEWSGQLHCAQAIVNCLMRSWRLVSVTKHADVYVMTVKDSGDAKVSEISSHCYFFSRYLDDVALHHLVDALCRLSTTSMEQAQTNKVTNTFNFNSSDTIYCLTHLTINLLAFYHWQMPFSDWLHYTTLSILL